MLLLLLFCGNIYTIEMKEELVLDKEIQNSRAPTKREKDTAADR